MHTPGQWKIRAGYGKLMSEIGPEDRAVCTVWTKQPKYNQVTERSEPAAWAEGEANAALIAAAPDLLAALETLLEAHEAYHVAAQADVIGTATAKTLFERDEIVIETRAAIAKAKGEQP